MTLLCGVGETVALVVYSVLVRALTGSEQGPANCFSGLFLTPLLLVARTSQLLSPLAVPNDDGANNEKATSQSTWSLSQMVTTELLRSRLHGEKGTAGGLNTALLLKKQSVTCRFCKSNEMANYA